MKIKVFISFILFLFVLFFKKVIIMSSFPVNGSRKSIGHTINNPVLSKVKVLPPVVSLFTNVAGNTNSSLISASLPSFLPSDELTTNITALLLNRQVNAFSKENNFAKGGISCNLRIEQHFARISLIKQHLNFGQEKWDNSSYKEKIEAFKKIENHTNPNFLFQVNDSPEYIAFLQVFIEVLGNIEQIDGKNQTLLIQASKNGNEKVVKILLDAGADVNLRNKVGKTPFHTAIHVGASPLVVELLLAAGSDINNKDKWHLTPLHSSVMLEDKTTFVEILLKTGMVNLNALNSAGKTALQEASDRGHTKIVNLLKSHAKKEKYCCVIS